MSEQLENLGIWIPRVISEREDLSQTAKLVYGIVHGFTSNGKECYASNKTIGKWVGCAGDTISTTVSQLVDKMLIFAQFDLDNTRRLKSVPLSAQTPTPIPAIAYPLSAQSPINSIVDNKYIKNNICSPTANEIDKDFSNWWQNYPKKQGKGGAEKAYKKARKIASAEALLAGARKWDRRVMAGTVDRQYVPMPQTWLNNKRWLDEDDNKPQTGTIGVYN